MFRRALAVFGAAVMLLAAVFCAFETCHECEGETCRICAVLDIGRTLLCAYLVYLICKVSRGVCGTGLRLRARSRAPRACFSSPVKLRVRMNN